MTVRLSAAAGLASLLACATPTTRPIVYGTDQCAHCHMTIADPKFAAELVTTTGKVYVFDDIGCLSTFLAGGTVPEGVVHSTWAHDYVATGPFLLTDQLHFVRSEHIRAPMGSGLVAVAQLATADSLATADQGTRLDWAQVRRLAPQLR